MEYCVIYNFTRRSVHFNNQVPRSLYDDDYYIKSTSRMRILFPVFVLTFGC